FQLGFVAHPKRFNVAVTRAKALLIVVGNPAVLETSSDWAAFLTHCMAHNACRGVLPTVQQVNLETEANEEDDEDDEELAHHRALFEHAQALQVDMACKADAERRERERQHVAWQMAQEARQAEERRRVQQMQEEQDYEYHASLLVAEEEQFRRQGLQRLADLERADMEYKRQLHKESTSKCIVS
ncbi:hypothetical protein DYB32_006376, partial [Aphanomyces invadans]